MKKTLLAAVAAVALVWSAGPAADAATPDDTLVMAAQIDDIISLDPAEIFEFSGAEYGAQVYDRLVTYDVNNVSDIQPMVAESWEVSDDGKTFTFRIREGITFHSGNPLTAHDAAYSLQRAVKLDLSPAFILTQFGFTKDNVDQMITAPDDRTLVLQIDQPYAPTFVLYCLTAGVASIVDSKLLQEHEVDGDMGHAWLKNNSAGSGPFMLQQWRPSEALSYTAFKDYWRGAPGLDRVFVRHVPEAATQRLLLEQGDVDVARDLLADQLNELRNVDGIVIDEAPKGTLWYLGLNVKREPFQNEKVRQALKYLVDYEGMVNTILAGQFKVHQSFIPEGVLGEIDDEPYTFDVEKAKQLLAEAGYPDGFSITMDARNNSPTIDMAQAIQGTFAQGGINLEIIPGDGGQTLTKYRARNHDIYIGQWGMDYQDPHTNADTFAANPDNADDAAAKPLAWRNAWDIPEMTERVRAAVLERDAAKRARLYEELQREHMEISPFVIMFQEIEVVARSADVEGLIWGPSFDSNFYWKATKN
jgi:peptide/nickel transport system substrate-binding protein